MMMMMMMMIVIGRVGITDGIRLVPELVKLTVELKRCVLRI